MTDTPLDNTHELIDALQRAIRSELMRPHDRQPWPLVVVRDVDPNLPGGASDGDMLRVVDVVVAPDEDGAHIEIIVIPDGADPTIIG